VDEAATIGTLTSQEKEAFGFFLALGYCEALALTFFGAGVKQAIYGHWLGGVLCCALGASFAIWLWLPRPIKSFGIWVWLICTLYVWVRFLYGGART